MIVPRTPFDSEIEIREAAIAKIAEKKRENQELLEYFTNAYIQTCIPSFKRKAEDTAFVIKKLDDQISELSRFLNAVKLKRSEYLCDRGLGPCDFQGRTKPAPAGKPGETGKSGDSPQKNEAQQLRCNRRI
jgi:hypothetical protein